MWDVIARLRLVTLGLGVLAAGTVVEASVISYKAVKKNNVAITPGTCNLGTGLCTAGNVGRPCGGDLSDTNAECHVGTNNLSVVAGDTIQVEMFISGWASDFPADAIPNRIRTYQVKLNRSSYVSNDNGSAKPLGWCGPVDPIACASSAQCGAAYPEYPNCLGDNVGEPPTGCTCVPHTPESGGFIVATRKDFLLFQVDGPAPSCVTSSIDFKYFGLAENPLDAIADPGSGATRYLGTLKVVVSPNACGTFSISHVMEITSTFIADPAPKSNSSLPSFQALTLTLSDCTRQLLSCSPGHCNIDARIAHDRLAVDTKRNAFQTVMTFSKTVVGSCSNAPATPCTLNTQCPGGTCNGRLDFEVTVLPPVPPEEVPVINAITPSADPKIATINFQPRIAQTHWTCFRDKGSNKRCCMGSLPADAEDVFVGSYISEPADVFEVLDNLNGLLNPVLAIERCDTDRSARCSGADLLMVVDLLTGADAFEPVWDPVTGGDRLPALVPSCPTMTMPP